MSFKIPANITVPFGIDLPIQALQTDLSNKLSWLSHSFGRAFKNEDKDGQFVPECYVGGDEYQELLPDDSVDAMCFFDVDDSVSFENRQSKTNVRIIFFINLEKCFPTLSHRADENAIVDIYDILKSYAHGWELTDVKKIAKNIFAEYNYTQSWLDDMQPYFVCSFECELTYNYLKSECYT